MALHPHLPLLGFGVFSYFALHHFGRTNGFFRLLEAAISNGVYAERFTSNKSINDTANFFLAFFWPAVDGRHPGLSLACFAFVGQWIAGWTLITMEAYRAGNRGRVISYIVIFGLCYQVLGLALCAPLYLLGHVLTSPTASKPTTENVAISRSVLLSLIPALTIGMVLPTVLMSLATPSYLLNGTKANLVILWQFFPVWTSVLCLGFSYTLSFFQIKTRSVSIIRVNYSIVITLASVTHISALTLSLIPILAPYILNPAHVEELRSALLGLPPWPIQSEANASSMAEGTLWFIQYDYLLTSCAMLVWSVSLKLASTASGDHHFVSQTALQYVSALFRAAVLGPMGSAASLVWERDEALLGATTVSSDTIEVRKSQ